MKHFSLVNQLYLAEIFGKHHVYLPIHKLEEVYAAKGRFHHDTSHIDYMLDKARKQEWLTDELGLAIAFHDFIYDVTRKDNELRSAQEANAITDIELREKVKKIILKGVEPSQ